MNTKRKLQEQINRLEDENKRQQSMITSLYRKKDTSECLWMAMLEYLNIEKEYYAELNKMGESTKKFRFVKRKKREEKNKDENKDEVKKGEVIIYAGVGSTTWDDDANSLKASLESKGYEVVNIIPINGLDAPKVEYL